MRTSLLSAILLTLTSPLTATEVTITIENLAPPNGNFLTPVWVGFHDGNFDLYDLGAPASEGLERIAEDGNAAPLGEEFAASGAGDLEGVIPGPSGPIAPGETATMTFELDPSLPGHRYLSYASMVIPSNDAFIANGDPVAHPLFDGLGNFLGADFVVAGSRVLDAGTEVNDEIPANTAFLAQTAPDTGDVQGGTVGPHPGFLPVGSGGILDDPQFAGADFTLPGYDIARVTVTAARETRLSFPLSGDQEVPPAATTAIGECTVELDNDQPELSLACTHNVVDPTAAHIHVGGSDVNGPIVFDLGDPTSPIEATWNLSAEDVEDFFAGDLYVNVHSDAFPGGEVRGQMTGCIAGPTSLCLNEDRFQVSALFTPPGEPESDAAASDLTDDSGTFTFFDPENVELTVKVLDACSTFDRYWVFASGLTNVEVTLTVTDTQEGDTRTYVNPQGMPFESIQDTNAFATCP